MREFIEEAAIIGLLTFFMWCLFHSGDSRADNWYAEVGAGYAFDTPWGTVMNERQLYDWKGSNPTAVLEIGREFDSGLVVKYQHVSNWLTGFPFNEKHETALDHVVISYKVRW